MNAMDDKKLTVAEVVARYNGAIKPATLANWRTANKGPAYIKIGGRVMYRLSDLVAWENSQVRETGR